jgi:hypothetical protein
LIRGRARLKSAAGLTSRPPLREDFSRTKRHSHRAKDQGDLAFLRELFAAQGREPPD